MINAQGRTGILQIAVSYSRDPRSLPSPPDRTLSEPILPANKREGVIITPRLLWWWTRARRANRAFLWRCS